MSTASTLNPDPPSATPASALVADRLSDFSDKLSPMLVKELRQGLRAKTFISVFLTMQILLGVVMLIAMASSANDPKEAGRAISSIVFFFFSLAMLIIQPIRGIGTLHREIHHNTIELMVLTRLNAWKIVLGKWVSLVAQSALLLAAIAPYLVLRYWLGGMNLFGELSLLFIIFVVSAVLTAIIVGISCVPSVILRGLLPLLAAALMITPVFSIPFDRSDFSGLVEWASGDEDGGYAAVFAFMISACYFGWTALGIGVSMIAPIVENHSTLRRLVGLGLLGITLLTATFIKAPTGVWAIIATLIALPAILLAYTEAFYSLGPITDRFLNRGPLGYLAATFLHPGWPSGVFFSLPMIGLVAAIVHVGSADPVGPEAWIYLLGIAGSIVLPALIIAPFRVQQRFTMYSLVLIAIYVTTIVVSIFANSVGAPQNDFLWWLVWLPPVTFTMMDLSASFRPEFVLPHSLAWTGGFTALLCLFAAIRLRDLAKPMNIESDPP
ncbi:MAG: hypothetical protein MUF31_14345 [Akkermansiaceae bacterium]|nr:hypothetical protein [Akkermansiaceae bacterium]